MKIAVASGKGGTGKTFVATNVFHALQDKGHKSLLIDCDAEAPNATSFFDVTLTEEKQVYQDVPVINTSKCTFCGKCNDYCQYHAIFILPPMKVIHVLEELCHGCGACSAACEDGAITEKAVSLGEVRTFSLNGNRHLIEARMKIGAMSPVKVIKAAISHTEQSDGIVIMDAPPGTSCPFIHTVAAADYVILVTEPTPFGLSDLRQSVETLKTMGKTFGVIINRAGIGDDRVQKYLEEEKINCLTEIPFNREYARIYSTGGIVTDEFKELKEKLVDIVMEIERSWK